MDAGVAAVVSAAVTAGGAIVLAVAGWLVNGQLRIRKWSGTRKRQDIPELVGTTWQAKWLTEDGAPYVADQVEFQKWTGYNKFSGVGHMVGHPDSDHPEPYNYPIEGEVTAARIVVLVYRAERFPTESLIGSACLELGDSFKDMKGYWVGRRRAGDKREYALLPGIVEMTRMAKPAA